jgi:hypothetical protein
MRHYWLIMVALALFLVLVGDRVYAQSEPDRIIAGEHLSKLWDALRAESITIKKPELKSQIVERKLSAILLPGDQPQNARVIKRCFKDKTVFDIPDLEIPPEDYSQLMKYAKDGVFQRVGAIRESKDSVGLEAAKASLNLELSSRPAGEREAAIRFAGALLADLEPTEPQLAGYVSAFRDHVEKNSLKQLKTMMIVDNWLIPRAPYSWGSTEFSTLDLSKVNPSAVREFTVGDKLFRKSWVGATYLIVYQGSSSTPRDPTGLGLSEDWFSSQKNKPDFATVFAKDLRFKM